jgi:outer membrane protein
MRALISLLALLASATTARAEDLLQVYADARASDPVLAAADAAHGVQRELATQARAPLLPQWSLAANESRNDGQNSRGLSSGISQTLFDLSQWRQWDAAQLDASAQEARLRAAEQALCARVATAYFGVLLAQANLTTAQANEAAFTLQVQQSNERFRAGLNAQLDVDQARTFLELARGGTAQAVEQLADARQALAQISGRLPERLQVLRPDIEASAPAPQEAQAWVERAVQANPTLQSRRLDLSAGERRIDSAAAAHLPTLSVGADSARNSGAGVPPALAGRTDTTVALRLRIPLFAGGYVESQKRQAIYQRDGLRDQLEIERRGLVRETQAQYQAVLSSMAQMTSARAAVTAADQALAATRVGQTVGTRTSTDLLLAIQAQAQAQNALEQARHRHVLAKLLLLQAAGSLGETELAQVNTLLIGAN